MAKNNNNDFNLSQVMYEVSKNTGGKEVDKDMERISSRGTGSNSKSYQEVLATIRELLSTNHAAELANIIEDPNAEKYIKGIITKYISENEITVNDIDSLELLVDTLYESMAGFDFLTEYIYNDEVEEINGNAYNDIEIVTPNGWRKLDTHFHSPQHSIDIVQKMMRLGGIVIDGQKPSDDSYITKGVRISAIIPPCVDDDVGAVFSIRKQKNVMFSRDQLIQWGTATEEELDFLTTCINYGISVGIAGATGSGKTTDIAFLLSQIPNDKRIYTIEDSREFNNIIRTDDEGRIVNRVIHTKTRPNERREYNVDANILLKRALRFHPDIIVPAEMRGEEAMTAQEAGRTGHVILTSLHASTALAAYTRILTMCMMSGTRLSEDLMLKLIIEAFPIMAFKKQLPDKTRKFMKIIEAEGYEGGKIKGRTLYKYVVTGQEKTTDGNRIKKTLGYHKKINPISHKLANRLLENGADIELIKRFAGSDWNPENFDEGDDDL